MTPDYGSPYGPSFLLVLLVHLYPKISSTYPQGERSKTGQRVGHGAQVNKNLPLFLCLLIRN
jgi:hypothetical protein